MFGGNFAPAGWAFCEASILPISENDVLFTLIGTTYGGDGQETFALPDLRAACPCTWARGRACPKLYHRRNRRRRTGDGYHQPDAHP